MGVRMTSNDPTRLSALSAEVHPVRYKVRIFSRDTCGAGGTGHCEVIGTHQTDTALFTFSCVDELRACFPCRAAVPFTSSHSRNAGSTPSHPPPSPHSQTNEKPQTANTIG
jgi:hypothetical protein